MNSYPASKLTVNKLNLLEVKKQAGIQTNNKEQDNNNNVSKPKK